MDEWNDVEDIQCLPLESQIRCVLQTSDGKKHHSDLHAYLDVRGKFKSRIFNSAHGLHVTFDKKERISCKSKESLTNNRAIICSPMKTLTEFETEFGGVD